MASCLYSLQLLKNNDFNLLNEFGHFGHLNKCVCANVLISTRPQSLHHIPGGALVIINNDETNMIKSMSHHQNLPEVFLLSLCHQVYPNIRSNASSSH